VAGSSTVAVNNSDERGRRVRLEQRRRVDEDPVDARGRAEPVVPVDETEFEVVLGAHDSGVDFGDRQPAVGVRHGPGGRTRWR
jgi:hypothetical protein